MDSNLILLAEFDPPWWAVVIVVIFLMAIFGKKKEFEYEAKLFQEGSEDIKGEIEIEKYKKNDPQAKLELWDKSLPLTGEFLIRINDQTLSQFNINEADPRTINILFPLIKNKSGELQKTIRRHSNSVKFGNFPFLVTRDVQPKNQDSVVVSINGEEILKGLFYRD